MAIPTKLLFTVIFLLHIRQRVNALSSDCLPCGAGAPGSAWKVSGSTGHPLLVPQPLWTRITIPSLAYGKLRTWQGSGGGTMTKLDMFLSCGDNQCNLHLPWYQNYDPCRSFKDQEALQVEIRSLHIHFPLLLPSWPDSIEDGTCPHGIAPSSLLYSSTTLVPLLCHRGFCAC